MPWLASSPPASPSRTSPHGAGNPKAAAARAALRDVFPPGVAGSSGQAAGRAAGGGSAGAGARGSRAGQAGSGSGSGGAAGQGQGLSAAPRRVGDTAGVPLSLKDEARRVRIASKVRWACAHVRACVGPDLPPPPPPGSRAVMLASNQLWVQCHTFLPRLQ